MLSGWYSLAKTLITYNQDRLLFGLSVIPNNHPTVLGCKKGEIVVGEKQTKVHYGKEGKFVFLWIRDLKRGRLRGEIYVSLKCKREYMSI